jgi:allophanate hydrolase subunit 1
MKAPKPALEVLATGPLTLIQDLGRPGLAALGVGRAGAADRRSFEQGAFLLAQDRTAAAIEVTFGGLAVRAVRTGVATLSADRRTSLLAGASRQAMPYVVEILVHHDGPDLDEFSELAGLLLEEVVAAHTQTPWRVAFLGFAPGFAYLAGGDSRLQVPRRSETLTSVPAGSVGLAGEFSAVYPRSSPGGWRLLGHTDAILWDVDRQPPALLHPGSLARFIDVDQVASR